VSESRGTLAQIDQIGQFDPGDGDVIDLREIDAIPGGADDAFTYEGTNQFSGAAGQLRIQIEGDHYIVQISTDADPDVEMSFLLYAFSFPTINAFLL